MANSLQNRPRKIWNVTVNDRRECLGSNARILPYLRFIYLAYPECMWYDLNDWRQARMAKTKYHIELTDSERSLLTRIVCEEKESERTRMRARILLMSEETQPEKVSIKKLADMLGTTDTTIQTVRTEYAKGGVEAAVYRKQRTSSKYNSKITDEIARQIREIAASTPPEGKKKWSSRMICVEAEKRGIVDHIVSSTVCKILREANIDHEDK